jgi:toxin FitB
VTMYLLNTNSISESRKLGWARINHQVARWLSSVEIVQTYISAMTVFELERGVALLERRDLHQGALLRRWFDDQVLVVFEKRILHLIDKTALICAELHVPDPKSERDAWIAANAIEASLTIATRNVADFSDMGVEIINPFEPL